MKPTSWACFRAGILLAVALCAAVASADEGIHPRHADFLPSQSEEPPAQNAGWRAVGLPHSGQTTAWYRIEFEAPAGRADSWAIYLPYLYGGGRVYLNGVLLAGVAESGAGQTVRWERPFLFPIPEASWRPGLNVVLVRASAGPATQLVRMSLPGIGPHTQLLSDHERRRFWVRSIPQFTVIACVIVGVLVLFIWWRRREEFLYGLFGLAALLWGARTLTFIFEVLPEQWWPVWRLLYHSATGGFIIVLTVFALRLAGRRRLWLEGTLLGFWLLGPLGYMVSAGNEHLIGRVWSGGLIPIGMATLVMSAVAALRQRTGATVALFVAITLAVAAGVHDYLLAGNSPLVPALLPQWAAHRIFMLHFAANLLLLVMGGILSARFVGALQAVEQMNRTLESRVAERERALADNYAQLSRLERQHAADDERQRIMRDLHDGLGSQLFVTLSRVESRDIAHEGIAHALRDCIADMRLALEAMSPDGNDFLEAWSNFRFRWERQLETAGLESAWNAQAEDGVLRLAPHSGLQVLRIAQEGLTNVLKHAGAKRVNIELHASQGRVRLEISDDGCGAAGAGRPGRGLANMRARAVRLGGQLELQARNPGTRLCLEFAPHPSALVPATANAG